MCGAENEIHDRSFLCLFLSVWYPNSISGRVHLIVLIWLCPSARSSTKRHASKALEFIYYFCEIEGPEAIVKANLACLMEVSYEDLQKLKLLSFFSSYFSIYAIYTRERLLNKTMGTMKVEWTSSSLPLQMKFIWAKNQSHTITKLRE